MKNIPLHLSTMARFAVAVHLGVNVRRYTNKQERLKFIVYLVALKIQLNYEEENELGPYVLQLAL
jgi:hypothetical protein